VPQPHTFARSLCGDAVRAADPVQEALARDFDNIERCKPGTTLYASLLTIVRDEHDLQLRRRDAAARPGGAATAAALPACQVGSRPNRPPAAAARLTTRSSPQSDLSFGLRAAQGKGMLRAAVGIV
jgi:DNA-directed RNA polymerase specialized sigma24 family protein